MSNLFFIKKSGSHGSEKLILQSLPQHSKLPNQQLTHIRFGRNWNQYPDKIWKIIEVRIDLSEISLEDSVPNWAEAVTRWIRKFELLALWENHPCLKEIFITWTLILSPVTRRKISKHEFSHSMFWTIMHLKQIRANPVWRLVNSESKYVTGKYKMFLISLTLSLLFSQVSY